MKKLTIKDIEKAIEESGILEYPKYIGNGLWKLSENCITGEKGVEEFYKALNDELLNDPSMLKVIDVDRLKDYIPSNNKLWKTTNRNMSRQCSE